MKLIKRTYFCILVSLLTACNIYDNYDCDVPKLGVSLRMNLNEGKLPAMTHRLPDRVLSRGNALAARYNVEVYNKDTEQRVYKENFYKSLRYPEAFDVNLPLAEGNYCALIWMDYTEGVGEPCLYYSTQDLTNIQLNHEVKGDSIKEAFTARYSFRVEQADTIQLHQVTLQRACCFFELLTCDYDQYIAEGNNPPAYIEYTFYNALCHSFDVNSSRPISYVKKQTMKSFSKVPEGSNCILGYDWVIINPSCKLAMSFAIYDADGALINTIDRVDIPVERNRKTIIKGSFLTQKEEKPDKPDGGGGIIIDDKFDGEIEIILP